MWHFFFFFSRSCYRAEKSRAWHWKKRATHSLRTGVRRNFFFFSISHHMQQHIIFLQHELKTSVQCNSNDSINYTLCKDIKVNSNVLYLLTFTEYVEAQKSYTDALAVCPVCYSKQRSILFSNRAAARMHLVHFYTNICMSESDESQWKIIYSWLSITLEWTVLAWNVIINGRLIMLTFDKVSCKKRNCDSSEFRVKFVKWKYIVHHLLIVNSLFSIRKRKRMPSVTALKV